MYEVRLPVRSPEDLAGIVHAHRLEELMGNIAPRIRAGMAGHTIVNVNSTDAGGGVAEMLHVLLPFTLGAGVSASWYVMEGDPWFFEITKRIHNRLHGEAGDGGPLGSAEHEHVVEVVQRNSDMLRARVRLGDAVIIHDPQPAGLAAELHDRGIPVVWRCHVGVDHRNEYTKQAWDFLRPFLADKVDAYVFTRRSYAPDWIPQDKLHVILPSIDPLSPKNQYLGDETVIAALSGSGIITGPGFGNATFRRQDGSVSAFGIEAEVTRSGPVPSPDVPLIVQISRWDPLKDMAGVMRAFAAEIAPHTNAELALVGPAVAAVSDDPEGQQVLQAVTEEWQELPDEVRNRVHLVSLPMTDPEANGALVNAIQRHAAVVVQKSLAEGFGLTVTEALYKGRPVVASNVGGIRDQIRDGVTGLLIDDPRDLRSFGDAVNSLIKDPELAARLGAAAQAEAIDSFLPDSSLAKWHQVVLAAAVSRAEE